MHPARTRTPPARQAHPGLRAIALACALLFSASARAQHSPQTNAVAQLLAQGTEAMQKGDLATAEAAFQHAVTLAPRQSEAHLSLGLLDLRKGEVASAIASLKQAIALNPKLPGAHMFLGIAEYQLGRAEAADTDLRAELALSPNNVEALTWMGIVALGSEHPEQAVAPLDRAAALEPRNAQLLYYQARAHEQVAQAALSRLYQLDPDSALVHRALAEDFAGQNQPEKSVDEYTKALTKEPGNTDLLEGMAEQQQKLSRFDDAEKTYRQELAQNPASGIALYNLGRINVEHGKPEDGVALLQKAVDAHTRPAPTDFYLGFGLAELGRNTEAAHWLEQSLASQPSPFIESSAYFQLARVYRRLGRNEEAEHALARLKQLKAQGAPGNTSATQ